MIGLGLPAPALAVRRRGAGAAFAFDRGALPPGAVLTRGSAATAVDAAGVLVSNAANVARFDRDPVTLARRGLLIEPAATNLVLRAQAFDHNDWSKAGYGTGTAPTVSADYGIAPDGTTTADRVQFAAGPGSGGGDYSLLISPALATGTGPCAASFWARLTSGSSGTLIAYVSYPGANETRGSFVLSPQWRRCTIAAPSPTATVYLVIGQYPALGGDAAIDVLLWGAQVEHGPPTSYIATAGVPASRAADGLTLDWGGKGVTDGTIAVRYTFDDGTCQDRAATVSAGTATVPTDLARARLRRAERR